MTIKACETCCGVVYEVECDECGDLFVEGCDSFEDAVVGARERGYTRRQADTARYFGPDRWHNFCACCAADMRD